MNFHIGLSGLQAAQRAIELTGTNLANASTEGYHRQELKLSPLELGGSNTKVSIGGVNIDGTVRSYDVLLEREQLRQQPHFPPQQRNRKGHHEPAGQVVEHRVGQFVAYHLVQNARHGDPGHVRSHGNCWSAENDDCPLD